MIKSLRGNFYLIALAVAAFSLFSFVLQNDPWDASQLIEPAVLAKKLNDPKAAKPVILNVGPMEKIKYAKDMGAGASQKGIEAFKAYVDKLPLQQEIVVYCGCCKLVNCPNIKNTMLYLETRGYTNFKLLNIPTSLEDDWIKKGYPMAAQ